MQVISKTVAAVAWQLGNQDQRPEVNATLPEQLIKDMKTARDQNWGQIAVPRCQACLCPTKPRRWDMLQLVQPSAARHLIRRTRRTSIRISPAITLPMHLCFQLTLRQRAKSGRIRDSSKARKRAYGKRGREREIERARPLNLAPDGKEPGFHEITQALAPEQCAGLCLRNSCEPVGVLNFSASATGPAPCPRQTPQQTAPPTSPAPAPPSNPFETIPQADQPRPGPIQQPQFEAPKPAEPGKEPPLGADIIEGITFRGARRVPQDTLRNLIFTRVGDVYNEDTLRRDFMALWNQNRFDDITIETEKGERGGIVITFVVVERPVIRDIKYEGAKSVSTSDILDRFKERKVGLTVESMYDPNVVNHAAVVLKELLAEHGHQFATVTPDLKRIPPSSLEVVFNVVEGPKIQVGKITILGNKAFSQREVIEAMKNLHGIGIPHSIFFEDIFPSTFDSAKLRRRSNT